MHTTIPFTPSRTAGHWIASAALNSTGDAYVQYLAERGYASGTIYRYFSAVAHFAHWLSQQRTSLSNVDERQFNRFIENHLLDCRCALRCECTRHTVRAALRHLLSLLIAQGQCAPQGALSADSIAAELTEYSDYLADVRGLSSVTCSLRVHHVRHFLVECFSDGAVQISLLKPSDVTRFISLYAESWTPASIRVICTSLRSYLNFRASRGEQTAALIAALPQIAQ